MGKVNAQFEVQHTVQTILFVLFWRWLVKKASSGLLMTTLPMPMERMLFPDKYKSVCLYMRIQHKPGDAIEVDWAGDTIPIFDSVTGEQSKAYLFVAVLPCSYFAYAEVCGVSAQ